MKSYSKRYPLVGRRWRDADCRRHTSAVLALALTVGAAQAACPPNEADGVVLTAGELVLAYRQAGKAGRIPMAKHFALEIQLCDRGNVSAARLVRADATMPEHRHGMNYRPQIKPLGGGRFRVDGMMLHMAGHWELAFEVQAGKEVTRFTHDLRID